MSSKSTKPNIYTVAERAGVSHQTVSRVINDHPSLRPETRARVLAAMEELGYVPNQAARALVTSKSGLIGILATDTVLYGPAGMLHAIEVGARNAGYVAIACSVDGESKQAVRKGLEHLRHLGVEGLIVITPQSHSLDIAHEVMRHLPVVAIDNTYRMGELSASIDSYAGATQATQHLIDLGHRKIVHITGPATYFEAAARSAAYTAAMLAAGLTPRIIDGDWDIETGHRLGHEIDFLGRGITAVFAANDHLALGLLKACRERGISVPRQVSVVGFDDIPEAGYFVPALTTVRQDFTAAGARAVDLLVRALAGEGHLESETVTPVFIERESTGPAPTV